jgi:two-component system CheB/CheR fusion protein
VFQNLLSNAIKFSRKGINPVINITCERIHDNTLSARREAKGEYIRLQFSDNGIGFSEKHIEKIFLIFQRLHARNDFEGTGIGLAIVKSIIDKHNGLITAQSTEGEGAVFIITLPIRQEHVEEPVS